MKRFPLTIFLTITFALTWGLGSLMFFFGDALTKRFGEFDYDSPFYAVLFHVAVYAPAIVCAYISPIAWRLSTSSWPALSWE